MALCTIYLLSILIFSNEISSLPPDMQSIRIAWTNQPVRQMPLVQNFYGGVTLRRDVQPGFGLISLGPMTLSPFRGNFQNSTINFNGLPLHVENVEWTACEGIRIASSVDLNIQIRNAVRMPFESHSVIQIWNITVGAMNNSTHNNSGHNIEVFVNLDGPFFRQCDELNNKYSTSCGWGTRIPIDRGNFSRSIVHLTTTNLDGTGNSVLPVAVTTDSLTNAVSATALWAICPPSATCTPITLSFAPFRKYSGGYNASLLFTENDTAATSFQIRHVIAVGDNQKDALATLQKLLGTKFDMVFADACSFWEKKWKNVFEPNEFQHFPGNLPTLSSNSPSLDRLYYWASLALVSLERTNMLSYPRQFVISEGASNSLSGDFDMGGAGQFTWDLSFSALSMTLLDPSSTRNVLTFIIKNSNLSAHPVSIPMNWDAYPVNKSNAHLGVYCFDYVSAFLFIQQYVVLTNDTAFLMEHITNVHDPKLSITVLDFLRRVVWAWRSQNVSNVSEFLVDYGSNKRLFLEAVPTYTNIIPALQFSNAGMMLSFARLLEGLGNTSQTILEEIQWLRGNASGIIRDSIKYQYVESTGFWRCLKANGSAPVEVRAISDMIYIGFSMGLLGRSEIYLPPNIRAEMITYFEAELLANGWVRALSLSDPVMANVDSLTPTVEDLVAMRADWTGTGAYGGLAGFAVDSLTNLEQGFDAALITLRNISLAASPDGSMPAQGIAVMTPAYLYKFLNKNDGIPKPKGPFGPAFPEFFDEKDFPPWWPNSLRSIQNAEASIVDSFIRSIFGWRPDWPKNRMNNSTAAIDAALFLPDTPRQNFKGTLSNLRTPYGLIDITADDHGISWKFTNI